MSKMSGKKRNLMSVDRLLSRIAKYANEPEKRLKEAHQMTRATFLMVQGMRQQMHPGTSRTCAYGLRGQCHSL